MGSTSRRGLLGSESSELRLAEFEGRKDLPAKAERTHRGPESGGRQGGLGRRRGGLGLTVQLDFVRSLDFTLSGKGRSEGLGLWGLGVSSGQRRPPGAVGLQ